MSKTKLSHRVHFIQVSIRNTFWSIFLNSNYNGSILSAIRSGERSGAKLSSNKCPLSTGFYINNI